MGFGDMATQTTPQTSSFTPIPPAPSEFIPPLENGDRLTRVEFERRYSAMPHVKKAELIEGIVYMPSPIRFRNHGTPQGDVLTVFGVYSANTPGVRSAGNTSVRLDLENEPQPDGIMIIYPNYGCQARISDDDYIENSPELLAEISASTVSIDLHDKFKVYRRNGVKEYIVWRVQDEAIDWFILRGDDYERIPPSPDGILKSETFPGLWFDTAAMLAGDMNRALETLRVGIATPDHQAFVAQLKEKAG
jgi:Uma2 family endonuclease